MNAEADPVSAAYDGCDRGDRVAVFCQMQIRGNHS